MHKLAASATVAALTLMSSAASADWSGFYVAGHVDAGWGKADWAGFDGAEGGGEGSVAAASLPAPVGYANTTLFSGDEKDSGWGAGVGIGYNFQFDNIVLGAVLDWTWVDIGDSRTFAGCCGPDRISSDISNVGTLRAVLGIAMENVMPYVTGGWAWGDVNHTFRSSAGNGHSLNLDSSDGWTLGGGINVAIAENTALNLEVLYVDFGESSRHRSDSFPSEAAARVESHATIARIGVLFRL
jgi:outer membrane immunogenic protein